MSRQFRVAADPDTLKPVIEAMIFASEEPLSARVLIRLLAGERDNDKNEEETPQGNGDDAGSAVERGEESVREPKVETEPVEDLDVESGAAEVEGGEGTADATMHGGIELVEEIEGREDDEIADADDSDTDDTDADDSIDDDDAQATTVEILEEITIEGSPLATEVIGDGAELAEAMVDAESRSAGRVRRDTIDQAYLRELIDELNDEYEESGRAFRIVEVAGGFQFATIREYGEFVAMLSKEKLRRRLSPAALETLAIIAFRQPVSKPEVESIRGVNCDQVLLSLMEKNLVAITGRSEAVGRPLLYGTTEDFLRCFGLKNLNDLPKLREIEELMEEDAYTAEKAEVITVDADTAVEEIEERIGAAGQSDGESEAEDGLAIAREGEEVQSTMYDVRETGADRDVDVEGIEEGMDEEDESEDEEIEDEDVEDEEIDIEDDGDDMNDDEEDDDEEIEDEGEEMDEEEGDEIEVEIDIDVEDDDIEDEDEDETEDEEIEDEEIEDDLDDLVDEEDAMEREGEKPGEEVGEKLVNGVHDVDEEGKETGSNDTHDGNDEPEHAAHEDAA